MSEIEVLSPQGKEIKIQGQPYIIKPFVFDDFLKASKIINAAKQKLEGMTYKVSEKEDGSKDFDFDIFGLLSNAGEEAKMLCCLSIEKDAEFVGKLGVDEVAVILGAIIEVNLDFFTKKVMPQVQKVLVGLAALSE